MPFWHASAAVAKFVSAVDDRLIDSLFGEHDVMEALLLQCAMLKMIKKTAMIKAKQTSQQ